jgi:release factor glutamine methyltransferase
MGAAAAMRLGDLRRDGEKRLLAAGILNASQETLWLLESLGFSQVVVLTDGEQVVHDDAVLRAQSLFARRAQHEPLQYVLGTQDFCGYTFEVDPGVLIPRPETELLIEETVRLCRGRSSVNVIEVGTGSGCVAVSVAKALPGSRVWTTDLSETALHVARRNIRRHQVEDRVTALQGDLLSPLESLALAGRVDLLLSNPPYIADVEWGALPREVAEYEPRLALEGGPDGLRIHRRLVELAPLWLAAHGWLVLEIGQNQSHALTHCIKNSGGYREIVVRQDGQGIDRVVCAQSAR